MQLHLIWGPQTSNDIFLPPNRVCASRVHRAHATLKTQSQTIGAISHPQIGILTQVLIIPQTVWLRYQQIQNSKSLSLAANHKFPFAFFVIQSFNVNLRCSQQIVYMKIWYLASANIRLLEHKRLLICMTVCDRWAVVVVVRTLCYFNDFATDGQCCSSYNWSVDRNDDIAAFQPTIQLYETPQQYHASSVG